MKDERQTNPLPVAAPIVPPDVSGVVERLRLILERAGDLNGLNFRTKDGLWFAPGVDIDEAAALLLSLASERERLIHDNARLAATSSELATENKALTEALTVAGRTLSHVKELVEKRCPDEPGDPCKLCRAKMATDACGSIEMSRWNPTYRDIEDALRSIRDVTVPRARSLTSKET